MAREARTLGKYRIMRRIADGGFASVYRAKDTIEGLTVALKIPTQQSEEHREELYREVRLTASLEHPNILAIKNATIESGKFVIAYRIGEESLADRLARRLAQRTALQIAGDLLSAVAYAHAHRVIHRDIKPDNIILLEDGRACLSDFGIAKLALRTRISGYDGSGTYGYMAPEHALGKASFRSDVFSIGLLLWRLFSGHLPEWPFTAPLPGQARIRQNYGRGVLEMLQKALNLDERKRFANAGAMDKVFRAATRQNALRKGRRKGPAVSPTRSWKETRAREFRRLVGRRFGAVSTCSACEGPIAETMQYCPWCAHKPKLYEGPTSEKCRCTRCGRGVKADWKYCAWCYGPQMPTTSLRHHADKRYIKRCVSERCTRRVVLPYSRYCPWCRTKVEKSAPKVQSMHTCTRCTWPVVRGSWEYCPWCGTTCGGPTTRSRG